MSEMVERVAKAIFVAGGRKNFEWPNIWGPTRQEYIKLARAAITAMREPTRMMIAAGDKEAQGPSATASSVWQAMIDAALAEQPK